MTLLDFINYFTLIKPTIQEIEKKDSSLARGILADIYAEYDLRITSMEIYSDLIIDLLMNTNLCDLSFSVFHFSKNNADGDIIKIGGIEEKGELFFDVFNKVITFKSFENEYLQKKNERINQIEFVKFLLKYLELDFNRTFREITELKKTKDISLNYNSIVEFSIIEVLLNEIGFDVVGLTN